MQEFLGLVTSSGVGVGRIFFLKKEEIKIEKRSIEASAVEGEITHFKNSRQQALQILEKLAEDAEEKFGADKRGIFEGQALLLDDESLEDEVFEMIRTQKLTAAAAFFDVMNEQIDAVAAHKDEYLRARATDLRDLRDRVVHIILGNDSASQDMKEDSIVVTDELTPSDTITLDLSRVKGFLTTSGGVTSHAAIIARSLLIPSLMVSPDSLFSLKAGDLVILDGHDGRFIISPSTQVLADYQAIYQQFIIKQEQLKTLKDKPAVTLDGFHVALRANIGTVRDMEAAKNFGAEGVGLFRSEFLFMESPQAPSEDVQFEAYRAVIQGMAPHPVTIRTLDVGGDKEIPYLKFPPEMNPFLGWRAVRMYYDEKELISSQFRAILRASAFGPTKIMVPMVTGMEEVAVLEKLLKDARAQLDERSLAYDKNISVGIMIETPSAALLASHLAKKVDFFSVGTNDLTQYTIAVDRGNQKIAYLYDPLHPAVLRLIKMTLDAGKASGIDVSICGELASDPRGILFLVGSACTNLSMTASSLLAVKDIIRKCHFSELQKLAETVVEMGSSEDVISYIDEKRRAYGLF